MQMELPRYTHENHELIIKQNLTNYPIAID